LIYKAVFRSLSANPGRPPDPSTVSWGNEE
jgi:hypothetical protein